MIEALPPIPTTDLKSEDVTELTQRVQQMMVEKYEILSKEVVDMAPPLESRI